MTMIPKIRFSEFEEEWEESTIGDIAKFSKGNGYSKSDLSTKGNPIILYGSLYTNYSSVIEDVKTYAPLHNSAVLSKGNEVIIPASGETPEDIAIASAIKQKGVILGGDLNVLSFPEDYDSTFMALNISFGKTHRELIKFAQGKTVVHLHNSDIALGKIATPTLSEQRRISQFFTLLDETIRLEGERLASLQQVKAASLQSFFPQEGEKEPRVRFKGFSGEWKKVKLSECLEISTERNLDNFYGKNDVLSVSEELGVRNQIELLGRSYAGQSVTNYNVLRTNQIVYTKSPLKAKPYGIVKVNKGETGIVSVLYAVYNVKEGISPDYIHWYFTPNFRLNNYLHPLVNKGAKNTMNISDEDALKGEIMIPSTLAEQRALSAYFTNIDEQIRLVSEKIEKMKKVKGACLEGMMV